MPPLGADWAVPMPPLHNTFVVTVAFDASADVGWVMVTLPVEEQPLLSLTIKV